MIASKHETAMHERLQGILAEHKKRREESVVVDVPVVEVKEVVEEKKPEVLSPAHVMIMSDTKKGKKKGKK